MLETKEQNLLRRKPSRLNNKSLSTGPNWDDALRVVIQFPEDQGPILNKYYQNVPNSLRPKAAAIIAASQHRHSIRHPDATYLYAWLENVFTTLRAQFPMGGISVNTQIFGGRNTSVLSSWLRADPLLLRSLPFLVSSAFKRSGAYSNSPHEMALMLEATVPRQFRKKRFYPEFVTQVPTALIVAAPHMSEQACLLNMCEQQCRYAAGLSLQWRSVYPDSLLANDVNKLLNIMQGLETYSPFFLLSSLGFKTGSVFEAAALPKGFDLY